MIRLHDLHKSFGAVATLRGLTLQARDGEVTGLLGANGSGKTTTFRTLAGLLRPDQGDVHIDNISAAEDPVAVRRALGVLPHVHAHYERLTTRENIAFYGELHGVPAATIRERMEQWFEILDMHALADRRTKGFSEGQRVKVALCRALIHEPANVVLDEPTAGLDVRSNRAVRALIHRLRDQGRCVLLSGHSMGEMASLCDRIAIIADGTVVAEGSVRELCDAAGTADLEEAFLLLTATEQEEGLRD
ncbi:MAG: ATP-binding cassette domain-containing protein [Myxococcales bacterium]|nr:ATP-binding cassette domain-containing protein [Myxococcales bacterium]